MIECKVWICWADKTVDEQDRPDSEAEVVGMNEVNGLWS